MAVKIFTNSLFKKVRSFDCFLLSDRVLSQFLCLTSLSRYQHGEAAGIASPDKIQSKKLSNKEHQAGPQIDIPCELELDGIHIIPDNNWNITPNILRLLSRRILDEEGNPLSLLKRRIVGHFNTNYRRSGNRSPLFVVCEKENRLVPIFDNFDSLLIPHDHPSRRPSDTYYANSNYCLRGHTSAHQFKLLRQGLDNFLVIGDVYRRDLVDRTHYPCFHQIEGVRTYSADELFGFNHSDTSLFSADQRTERDSLRQERHTIEVSKKLVSQLQCTLEQLCKNALFGTDIEMRWVDAYFPFTHPSFELEVFYEGQWLEVLGCGVIEQKLLDSAGNGAKVGWAFGLGLERLAMILYGIPDIRLFWSHDTGFLSQFASISPEESVKYKPVSIYPQLLMDLSFWLPSPDMDDEEVKANVQDTIRSVGGDLVEQVDQIDVFFSEKRKQKSHCYKIIYRSMDRVLTKIEINQLHKAIEKSLIERFGVEIR